jgi:uncharacterized membrane protein
VPFPSDKAERSLRGAVVALAISYPLVAHLAVARNSALWAVAGLVLLAAIVLLPALVRGSVLGWMSAIAAGIGISWIAGKDTAWLPMYAPPVVLTFLMAWTFGRSLAPGDVPLIERMARLMHAPGEQIDPAIPVYARRLTLGWTVLLAILGTINLLLALCATPNGILLWLGLQPPVTVPREIWSLFANVLNYVIVGIFFVIEYGYRRYRFPQQPYANMFDFIRRAMAVGPRVFSGMRERA